MSIIHDALKKVEKEGVYQEPQSPKTAQPAPPSPVTGKKRGGFSLHIPSLSLRKNLLGVDIGSSSIKLVHLACSGGACRLKDVGYVKLPYGAGESGAAKALKTLLSVHGIGRSRVSSSIRNKSLTFSHIKLPKMPKDDLTEAVRWEVKRG